MQQMRARWQGFSAFQKLVVGGTVFVFLFSCCFCVLIAALPSGDDDNTQEVAEQEAASPEPSVVVTSTLPPEPSVTSTPSLVLSPTITPTPTVSPTPTTTPTMTATLDPNVEYEAIDVRDLAINPEAFRGAKIRLRGEVFSIQIEGGVTTLQMWVAYPGSSAFDREPVIVLYSEALSGVYEGTNIDVYGVGAGSIEGQNAFGATIVQPLLLASLIKVP